MGHIPVISISVQGIEKNEGFKYSIPMLIRVLQAVIYGDLFMRVVYATRPYEKEPGSTNALHEKWKKKCIASLKKAKYGEFCRNIKDIIREFDELPRLDIKKPRVGIVGEILVKFLPDANNRLVELLEAEGAEAVMPDLLDFMFYSFYNSNYKTDYLGKPKKGKTLSNLGIWALDKYRHTMKKALDQSTHFSAPVPISKLAELAKPFVSLGNQTGEGWFLTGEMMELIHSGAPNIVCTQPFACLPNHVVGKGVIKEIRRQYPEANIVAIDYDPGASEVNQINRIKLMLSTANKNLEETI